MTMEHPHENDLLAYVEDELARDRRDVVRMHLDSCAACRAQVAEVEAGRAALRAAPALELSPDGRSAILAGLGPAEPRRRRPSWRLVAVVAAALALATATGIAVTISSGDDTSDDAGAVAASGEARAESETTAGSSTAPTLSSDAPTLVGRVSGTPASVAQALRDDGFDAVVRNGQVVVQAEDVQRDDLERAVAKLGRGPVAVYVR